MKLTLKEWMALEQDVISLCEKRGHVMGLWKSTPEGGAVSTCKDCDRTANISSEGGIDGLATVTQCPKDDDHEPHIQSRR